MSGIPQVGAEFAGYRIERLLGRGGVGIVYLALDLRLQRRVALKILATELSNDERVRQRFAREPRLAASIDHPNIIPIYEAGESEGNLYIAMRHVDGCDLGALVRREGPLDAARAVAIVAQVGGALDAAHARGLYHRDVKPANILVVPRADPQSSDHAYVADFGITKNSSTRSLTKTGQYVGTLDYVAPEQIKGESVDGRTDIYALGCVLYESLTGVPPFQKDNDAASIYAHLAEDPPLLSAKRSGLPLGLDAVVVRAMAKSREERYATGTELAAAARRALGERGTRGAGATRARRRSSATVIATPGSVSDTRVVQPGPAPVPETRVVAPAPVPETRVVAPPPVRTPRRATAAGGTAATPATPVPEPPPHLDFRVLGPLEVWDGDRELSVGTGRQRALLARLLMETNMVVSTESLVDALWGDRTPPEAAAKALQTHVTTLRRALEPGRTRGGGGTPSILVNRSPGYLLRVDADDVDLGRFERLVEQGRRLRRSTPERASAVLREALELWRGPAFDGVSLEGAARAEVARIEELRLTALEERIEADLELERHEALVDELTALVAAHPSRERIGEQLTAVRARTAEPAAEAEQAPVEAETLAPAEAPAAATGAAAVSQPAATPPPPPPADSPAAAGDRPRGRRRMMPVLAGTAAMVAVAVAGAGLLMHSRSGGRPVAPAAKAGPPPYPTAAERSLATRFPPFVQNCHRYANHYDTTIAEVECQPSPDHPGAHSVVFQQFSNYGDLELHFHHVLALNIQGEAGRSVGTAYSGACADPESGYFAASTYPIAGVEAQDSIASPTAHGHLFCYVGTGGIPKLAWTNVGQLIVAQAAGDRSGPQAQADLLAFWEFAGPTGNPEPVAGSPDVVVKLLYHRYLQRDPESPDALSYWTDRLNSEGFPKVSNAFADSSEAKTRFTLPLMRGGVHGGAPAATPSPTP
ncbi:MAG TPA: BTAD domain-containing putative transcriptional regulator [Candidatus Dormibacteraeota bacterium]|jgi:serine/threonine-protein kinase